MSTFPDEMGYYEYNYCPCGVCLPKLDGDRIVGTFYTFRIVREMGSPGGFNRSFCPSCTEILIKAIADISAKKVIV